ncbi:MAG: chromosomal replication initiator protein DnaA [Myxococcales bacterium]|nr:chromosomal replication initiator protein DnaA [Myxococcales bacterium]
MSASWNNVLNAIEEKVPAPTFNRWFKTLTPVSSASDVLKLEAQDEFDALFVERNFAQLIQLHVNRISTAPVSVTISYRSPAANANVTTPEPIAAEPASEPAFSGSGDMPVQTESHQSLEERIAKAGLRARYTFENFVAGPSNEFALAASRAAFQKPGQIYSPLFLCGEVGLGKTHLLNAIGIALLETNADKRIRYMTCEAFMNEMVQHIQDRNMAAFRQGLRHDLDVLLIDDVQFLSGKDGTQQEFFHTFNSLHQMGAQIVLTSDRYPHQIPDLDERLRSRFQWGLIADIRPPSADTRLAIVRQKAHELDFSIPEDVAEFLATNVQTNIRELEGALLRLHAYQGFSDRPVTLELARDVLRQFLRAESRSVSVEKIQKTVCTYFNVRLADLRGKTRKRDVSHPRQIAMYLAKEITGESYPQLGKAFGGRDHTTVLAGYRRIESMISEDMTTRAAVENLARQLS